MQFNAELQIWVGFFAVGLCNGLMSNFSKSFGLTFINDDHFFSNVAIFQGISNGLCRIAWGYSYDKIGFKRCFITIGLAVTLGTAVLPLLPLLGQDTIAAQAGYAAVMVVLYGTFPGIYAVVAAAVADAFGQLHYKANFGLLFTQAVAYSGAILIATQVNINHWRRGRISRLLQIPVIHLGLGYNGIFLVAGACGVIGVINNCFVPKDLSLQKQKQKCLKEPI